ncbi:MAG: 30S ribosome-binding factor RbfA [Sumerlaeia bacterium]
MNYRAKRVEETLRTVISEIIQYELNDPRLPMIFSITDVKVSPDLHYAKIYFTQIPDEEEAIDETLDVLEKATGFMRSQVAQNMQLRYTPDLKFFYDEMQENAQHIEELIQESNRQLANRPVEDEASEDEDTVKDV